VPHVPRVVTLMRRDLVGIGFEQARARTPPRMTATVLDLERDMSEESRKAVRGIYTAFHGDDRLRNPTAEEWAVFTASCTLRDMCPHLCVLPTGEYCPKGLVCLGCTHAQPKQSAAPIFRRMLASHKRALGTAHQRGAGRSDRGATAGSLADWPRIATGGGFAVRCRCGYRSEAGVC
jgi:hypothetical protein